MDTPPTTSNVLVVKNLPFALNEEDVVSLLTVDVEVAPEEIKMHMDRSGKFLGTVFVTYANTTESARMKSAFSDITVKGRRVRTEYRNEEKLQQKYSIKNKLHELMRDPGFQSYAFPTALSAEERKLVHVFAGRMKLLHYSTGEGDTRSVTVELDPMQTYRGRRNMNERSDRGRGRGRLSDSAPGGRDANGRSRGRGREKTRGGERAYQPGRTRLARSEGESATSTSKSASAEAKTPDYVPRIQPKGPDGVTLGFTEDYQAMRRNVADAEDR